MRIRTLVLSLCVAVAIALIWVFVPSILRTENAVKEVAEQILKEEFMRLGVREDAFKFVNAEKSAGDWIVTWHSKNSPSAEIGVTLTLFEADVWGRPIMPNCKNDRSRTVVVFGEVC